MTTLAIHPRGTLVAMTDGQFQAHVRLWETHGLTPAATNVPGIVTITQVAEKIPAPKAWTGATAKILRLTLGLRVPQFADMMGVNNKTVYRWESRGPRCKPHDRHQQLLAQILTDSPIGMQKTFAMNAMKQATK